MIVEIKIDVTNDKLAALLTALSDSNAPASLPAVATDVKVDPTVKPKKKLEAKPHVIDVPEEKADVPVINIPAPAPAPVIPPAPPALPVAPEPVQAPVQAPSKTLEDIRALVLQIKPDVRVSKLMEVFQLVGADKLSAIPEKDYDFVYEQFKEALAEQA